MIYFHEIAFSDWIAHVYAFFFYHATKIQRLSKAKRPFQVVCGWKVQYNVKSKTIFLFECIRGTMFKHTKQTKRDFIYIHG